MELNELTDLEIVNLALADNADAFDELMRRYKRPVLNFVYRMLGNAADAEDVAQEVFVRVFQNLRGKDQGKSAGLKRYGMGVNHQIHAKLQMHV